MLSCSRYSCGMLCASTYFLLSHSQNVCEHVHGPALDKGLSPSGTIMVETLPFQTLACIELLMVVSTAVQSIGCNHSLPQAANLLMASQVYGPLVLLSTGCNRSTAAQIDPLVPAQVANLLPFHVIGNEAGYYPELQAPRTSLQMGPAQRFDVILDFSGGDSCGRGLGSMPAACAVSRGMQRARPISTACRNSCGCRLDACH